MLKLFENKLIDGFGFGQVVIDGTSTQVAEDVEQTKDDENICEYAFGPIIELQLDEVSFYKW